MAAGKANHVGTLTETAGLLDYELPTPQNGQLSVATDSPFT